MNFALNRIEWITVVALAFTSVSAGILGWIASRKTDTKAPQLYEDNVVGLVSVLITERTFFNPLYSSLYTLTCDGCVEVQYEHGSKTLFSLLNYDSRDALLDDLVTWCDENLTKEDQFSRPAQATAI